MPYPYGYAGGNSNNAFAQGLANGQSFVDHIQNAYTQREAQARMDAKTAHDNSVQDAETQMRLAQAGAVPVSGDGSISGQIAQAPQASATPQPLIPQAPATQIQTGGGADMGSPDDATQMSGAPAPLPAAPQPYASDSLAQSVTGPPPAPVAPPHMKVNFGGQQYQLPNAADKSALQDAADARSVKNTRATATAQREGENDADAENLETNGLPVPANLAKFIGVDPGTKMLPKDLHAAVTAQMTQQRNDTIAARADAAELDRKAHETAQEKRWDNQDRISSAMLSIAQQRADQAGAGSGGSKPLSNQQKISIENTKALGLARAQAAYTKATTGAAGLTLDPKAKQEAQDEAQDALDQAKQATQDAYEDKLTAAGVPVQHFDYATQGAKAVATGSAQQVLQQRAAAQKATPAAQPQTSNNGPNAPSPALLSTMKPGGVYTLSDGSKGRRNSDGSWSPIRGQ